MLLLITVIGMVLGFGDTETRKTTHWLKKNKNKKPPVPLRFSLTWNCAAFVIT